jgi:hypothetical protein
VLGIVGNQLYRPHLTIHQGRIEFKLIDEKVEGDERVSLYAVPIEISNTGLKARLS